MIVVCSEDSTHPTKIAESSGVEQVLESHEITDALPAQRDDEPPSLRRDIADEIVDHLQSAMRRELLVRGGDDKSAWQRVIQHFGDPRQVARRLWFQAMWSRIMTQRLVVISALVSMTLSVVLTAMVASMIHGQQQTNAALIEQISKLAVQKPAPAPERDPRWNNLKIKVTLGSKNGPAAEGLNVTVSKLPDIGEVISEENGNNAAAKTTAVRKKHKAETNAQGIVDCGFVGPGLYQLEVDSLTSESFSTTFTIYPGRDHVEEVVAPESPPKLTNVSFHLEGLPEDLDSKKYGLILSFHQVGGRQIDDKTWKASSWFPFNSTPFVMILPGRGVWVAADIPPGGEQWNRWPSAIFYPQKKVSAKWRRLEPPYRFQIPAYQYSVCFDFVRVPQEMTPDDPEWSRNMLHDPRDSQAEWTKEGLSSPQDPHVITLVAREGQRNEWTVAIPNPLLNAWERRPVTSPSKNSQPATAAIGSRDRQSGPFGSSRGGPFGGPRALPQRPPSLVSDGRPNSDLTLRLQLTSRQQSELHRLLLRRAEMLREFGSSAASSESKARVDARLIELEKEALEILTAEQKQLWEERRAELIQELMEADLQALKEAEENDGGRISRLRQEVYVTRAKLSDEQNQKLKEIESQLDDERRKFVEANMQTQQDEQRENWLAKFAEYDKQFAECLTEEQEAIFIRRIGPATRAPR